MGSVMVQPDRQQRQPSVQPETSRLRPARYKALAAARDRFEGSLAQSFLARLKALDFADQAMLFGGGLLASLLLEAPHMAEVLQKLSVKCFTATSCNRPGTHRPGGSGHTRTRSHPSQGHPANWSADVQRLDPSPCSRANSRSRTPGRRTAPLASTTPRRVSTGPVTKNMARQRVRTARANRSILSARAGASRPPPSVGSRQTLLRTYSFPVCWITA
jgi:hypothetical protein